MELWLAYEMKQGAVPSSCYGSLPRSPAENPLQALRGAVFSAMRTTCHMQATAARVSQGHAVHGSELDPEIIALNRVYALRRAWVNLPDLRHDMCVISNTTKASGILPRRRPIGAFRNPSSPLVGPDGVDGERACRARGP
jgi:hypothetical protein